MGLFKRKEQTQTCPICTDGFETSDGMTHWSGHVRQLPPGEGAASGQYTWECKCGPSGMKWPNEFRERVQWPSTCIGPIRFPSPDR